MLLTINSLIEWLDEDHTPPKVERILYYYSAADSFVLIDIFSAKSLPVFRSREELMSALDNKKACILDKDPFASLLVPENDISEKHRQIRDSAWDSIALIVEAEGLIPFMAESRGKLVTKSVARTGCIKKTIYKRARRYWQGGQCKNALLPDYKNCGTNSEWRKENPQHKKLGRPSLLSRRNAKIIGIIITPDIKRKFERGIKKYYQIQDKSNLRWAYRRTLNDFFHKGYEFKNSVPVPVLPPAEELPTFRQFYYWYESDFRNIKQELKARLGRRKFEMNYRALLGDSTAMAFGPGSVYQADATIGDVYLVSEFNRTRIIGRPVIYFIIDVFSRYVVGIAVTLEGPSWVGAMLALDNVVTDKVAFCAEYGITITAEQWNCQNLSEAFLGDRGEFEGYNANSLVNNLNIRIQNAPPYRADFKGIVERAFGKANEKFIHFLPGAVEKGRERGERDYRLDAVLTLKEFRSLLITYVLDYNANQYLSHYSPDEFLISDQVELYPQELWNWGIQNRSGHLRVLPQEIVRLNLLPRKTVSVTRHGIHFEHDLYYTCALAREEGWFERAGQRGSWKIEVAYDPRKMDNIYLPIKNGREIVTCHLTPSAKVFKLRDWYDAADYFASKTERAELSRTRSLQADAEFHAVQQSVIAEAKEKTEAARRAVGKQSKLSQTKNIRGNRAEERETNRLEQAFDLSDENENTDQTATQNSVTTTDTDNENYIAATSNIRRIKELTKKRLGK